jgi:drug/metabolite transporter (DMT)-like permease
MVIIRPSFADVGPTALLPVCAALCFAAYMTLTKKLAGTTDPWTMQTMAGLSGTVLLGTILFVADRGGIVETVIPNVIQTGQLLLIAAVAITCHTGIIFALQRVDAGLIAPLQYLEIIGAVGYGFLFFGDFPDAITWLGIAIIVGSGLFVFYREKVTA